MSTSSLFLLLLLVVILVRSAYKSRVSTVNNFNQGVSVFDDFLTPNTNTTVGSYTGQYFKSIVSGGTISSGSSENFPGKVTLNVVDLNDSACLYFPASLYMSNSPLLIAETRFQLDSLMSSGNGSEMYFGFAGPANGGDLGGLSNAIVFLYDKSISNNLIAYVKIGGVVTQTITTIAASTDIVYAKVVITGSYVNFLINNVLVATITATMPTSVPLNATWFLEKNLGGTDSQSLAVDAVGVYQQFTTPRIFSNTVVTQ